MTTTKCYHILLSIFLAMFLIGCNSDDQLTKDHNFGSDSKVQVINAQTFDGFIPQEQLWSGVVSTFAKGVLVLPNGDIIFTIKIEYDISNSVNNIAGIYLQERNSDVYFDFPLLKNINQQGVIEIPITIDEKVSGGVIDIIYAIYDDQYNVSPLRESWIGIEKSLGQIVCGDKNEIEQVLNTMTEGMQIELNILNQEYKDGEISYEDLLLLSEEVTFKTLVDLKILGQSCVEISSNESYLKILERIELLWSEGRRNTAGLMKEDLLHIK